MKVSTKDVISILPQQVDEFEIHRIARLIDKAERKIKIAFHNAGRDFYKELETNPLLEEIAADIIVEMVAKVVLVGNPAIRSVSSTTGAQSDQIIYKDVDYLSFGGVDLTSDMLEELGLSTNRNPRGAGSFPPPFRFPEVTPHGANRYSSRRTI